jgi:hypothetical protein
MNSKGQNGEKTGYLVILLLVVGLTAFSSTMKELSQVREFLVDTGRLLAQSATNIVPAEIPRAVVKLETCDAGKNLQQSIPVIELPWLDQVQEETRAVKPRRSLQPAVRTEFAPAPRAVEMSATQIAKLEKLRRFEFDPRQFEITMSTGHDAEPDGFINSEFPVTIFKMKTRKNGANRINPRDREMLKTLNRSINLRSAS